jgi:hypothetical protein
VSVRPGSVHAPGEQRGADQQHDRASHRLRLGARIAAAPIVVACVAAGVGWVYLLRDVGVLDFGPLVGGALPLQRLAGGDSQPLARMALAWLPMGVLAGLALRATGIRSRPVRAALIGVAALVLLVLIGAVSDSITASSAVRPHVSAQFGRAGTWVATALLVIGSLLVGPGREAQEQPLRDSAPTAP